MKKVKKIAIIRALDLRLVQAEYAAHFRKFKPVFVSNSNREMEEYFISRKVKYSSLKLKPTYLFDPVELLFGRKSHQSWLYFDNKELEKTIKNINYYQIQEPFFLYSGQIAKMADKYNKPLICAPWMCFNHPSTYIPPYSTSVKKVIEQTNLFIIRTSRVNNYLSQFNIPDSKKVLIYHGVNTKRFYPTNNKKSEKVKILFVGILHRSKGLDDILDIFPKLVKDSKKEIELVVCGRGVLEQKVKEMAKFLPINFLGQVPNLKLSEVYRDSDIFCGPSKDWYTLGVKRWEEGFGFVFAEALASGLPVVSNDCGAIKEIIGEENVTNKQGDKKALCNSLSELISSDNLRQEIGKKSRNRAVKMFNLETQVAKEENEIIKRFN